MAIDYAALNTELTTDPHGLGYASAERYVDAAEILNTPRAGGEETDVRHISGMALFLATSMTEFAGKTAVERQIWLHICSYDQVDMKDPDIRSIGQSIWLAGGDTRDAILLLQKRPRTRAEELFGDDTVVDGADVRKAMQGI